jgi:hypothetical protein
MKHLDRQVLSPLVVQGNTSINTARYEQVAMWPIDNLGEGLIKLSEFISDTCALNVEHSHDT